MPTRGAKAAPTKATASTPPSSKVRKRALSAADKTTANREERRGVDDEAANEDGGQGRTNKPAKAVKGSRKLESGAVKAVKYHAQAAPAKMTPTEPKLVEPPPPPKSGGRAYVLLSSYPQKHRTQEVPYKDFAMIEPFPMSEQILATIGSSNDPSCSKLPFVSPRPGKRMLEENEHVSWKFRTECSGRLESPTRKFESEDDSTPHVDPATLCPCCDTPLPSNPTPFLLEILAAVKKKGQRDPRPSNALGLKASMEMFTFVCTRHQFESQTLPKAKNEGWPQTIEWDGVRQRVLGMKAFLEALIKDPKAISTGIMGDFKGRKAVSGVREQFSNFTRTQTGYYGECGSSIIYQTLYDMFPPSKIDRALIAPLTGFEFAHNVLVPEVALRLIMEDKGLKGDEGVEEALEILRNSSSYGAHMFPADEDEMGVADLIVRQRAKRRRKELTAEEEKEIQRRKKRYSG